MYVHVCSTNKDVCYLNISSQTMFKTWLDLQPLKLFWNFLEMPINLQNSAKANLPFGHLKGDWQKDKR